MGKTLIVYASKSGAAEQAAQMILDVLKDKYGLEVDLVNLRKDSPNPALYENIIIGAGVRAGKVYREALRFLKQDFGTRKVAFFVSCGGAGDPKNYEKSCTKYITEVLAHYPRKILGKTIFNNVDPAKIRSWAETLGNKLAE
ncbi:MAG TPA: flavodoxin domain-containing protein [Candidatus Bathyarchaeia archaeon]|nr:flavodoxin domain-containing protein [Candidatus Bathyarchaeia archaeon]